MAGRTSSICLSHDVEAASIFWPRATFQLRYQRMREDYALTRAIIFSHITEPH